MEAVKASDVATENAVQTGTAEEWVIVEVGWGHMLAAMEHKQEV